MSYLVFDIGGTRSYLAISEDGDSLAMVKNIATPKKPETFLKEMMSLGEQAKGKVKAIAGGVRGSLNEEKTGVERDGVLKAWQGFDIVEALAAAFPTAKRICLDNDTAVAGLGEAHFGAAKGLDIVVYHSISTGVGGVKIDEGFIDHASAGFEPGHQVLDIDRTVLGPDITPTLENLISGAAVEVRMDQKPQDIPQEDVLWNELAGYLAQGLRNTILYWSPEVIVLGGSMVLGIPKIPLDIVRKETVSVLGDVAQCPFITLSKLGNEAGLYGALVLIKQSE